MNSDLDLPPSVAAALRGGVGDEPPLRLTMPDVLARGRRARQRRQLAQVAGGLATASLVGGVAAASVAVLHAAPAGGTAGGRPGHALATTPPAHTVAPPPNTGSPPPARQEPAARATARLDRALNAALRLPPGAHRVRVSWGRGAHAGSFYASQGGYKSVMDIADPAGTGNLFIEVGGWGPPSGTQSCHPAADATTTCSVTSLPAPACPRPARGTTCTVLSDGTLLTVSRSSEPHGVVRWTVSEQRVDGNSVGATVLNYGANSVPQEKNPPAPVAQRATPPLTVAQLTALVEAPGMIFYPPS
jgi:hypothetical protein